MEENQENENLSEEELAERLSQLIGTAPLPEEKQNIHTFLTKVVTSDDTTKLGYLKEEEIGTPILPLRTYKELALFCNEVADMDYYGDYLLKKGEILTSTSLSKDAKLLSLAVLQKKEIADVTKKQRKQNRGWFKPKKEPGEESDSN